MNNTLTKALLSMAFALGGAASHAQLQASAVAYVDTNNIRAAILACGDLWKRVDSGGVVDAGCYFPATSNKNFMFTGALWFGGINTVGSLHVKALEYLQQEGDFVPGPLYGQPGQIQNVQPQDSALFDKVWMINSSDIAQFLAQPAHTLANTPPRILDWPAMGNTNATGRGGQSLGAAVFQEGLAPFVDTDSDGVYNPLNGDYPAMKGHQMAWTVFNESGARHNPRTNTPAVGIQVQCSAYAYQDGSLLDDVVFYEYELWNRGPQPLDSFSLGLFADGDLGSGFDDYVRFDSARRMAVFINGTATDAVYGSQIPAAAVSLLEAPGDSYPASYFQPAIFSAYNNDASANGNPTEALQFYNYLNGRGRIGQVLDTPVIQILDGGAPPCAASEAPGDRRAIVAHNSGSQSFEVATKRRYAFALAVAPDAGGCPSVNVSPLQATVDAAWDAYYGQASSGVEQLGAAAGIALWPNPAKGAINIRLISTAPATAAITDLQGRTLMTAQSIGQGTGMLQVQALPPGVYVLRVEQSGRQSSRLFVKE